MGERLDLLRAVPGRVLDLGSGTGYCARALRARYARCSVIELDFSQAMLAQSRRRISWWRRGISLFAGEPAPLICADIEQLPFPDRTFDMIWSNLVLHWLSSPAPTFAEIHRVLRPGGVYLFSTLGPDTLKELRSCYAEVDSRVHVNRFFDLHDLGDMLVNGRFADPVMDMEYLTLTYADARTLMRELKAIGAHNVAAGRNLALSGKRAFATVIEAYERYRREGRLPATFEVVYGHAWRPETDRTTQDGRSVIEFHPNPRRAVR
jgi:malonyl-CoA O-methyltransferase